MCICVFVYVFVCVYMCVCMCVCICVCVRISNFLKLLLRELEYNGLLLSSPKNCFLQRSYPMILGPSVRPSVRPSFCLSPRICGNKWNRRNPYYALKYPPFLFLFMLILGYFCPAGLGKGLRQDQEYKKSYLFLEINQ